MKLDVGCGPVPQPGYVTVDAYYPADIQADMWAIPLPDHSVDEIWSSHALEHIPLDRILPTLREWYRLLRRGGSVTILVPDLDYVAHFWLAHRGERRALDLIFGNQANEGQFHKTGWNQDSLRAVLVEAGLTVEKVAIIRSHGQDTIRAVARVA